MYTASSSILSFMFAILLSSASYVCVTWFVVQLLCTTKIVLDEVQPAAGQSVEDGGALVFFQSTSAPDPDLACAYRQHLCTTGHFRSWSQALHRLWRQLTDTRHRHRQIVLRCLTAESSFQQCVPRHALLSLIRALIVSKVDYCCSV